jgi:glycerophosphoryl diester phosphodiesterase
MAQPPPVRFPFLDHPGPIPFAHQGGALEAPENTMQAFAAAIELGFRYLETDVQATADDVVVTSHDDELVRTTGLPGRITALRFTDLAAARVNGQEPIPKLEDVLGTWPDVRVNVDAKSDRVVRPLIDTIQRTRAIDRICVGSFSGKRLKQIRAALGPRLCTSYGPFDTFRWRLASIGPLGALLPDRPCAQVPVSRYGVPLVTTATMRTAHARGVQVHVWTVDDSAEMRRLLDLGVDGLISDRPTVLKQVLTERGQWA